MDLEIAGHSLDHDDDEEEEEDINEKEDDGLTDEEDCCENDEDTLNRMGIPLSTTNHLSVQTPLSVHSDFKIDEFRVMHSLQAALLSHDRKEIVPVDADDNLNDVTTMQPEPQRTEVPFATWTPAHLELPKWAVEMTF